MPLLCCLDQLLRRGHDWHMCKCQNTDPCLLGRCRLAHSTVY